jgi:hypothetical protein
MFLAFLLSFLAITGPLLAVAQLNPSGGGEYRFSKPSICLSDVQRKAIQQMLRQNERLLEQKSIFLPKSQQDQPLFFWTIRQAPGFKSPSFWGTAYFVDHNPAYPNQVLDYPAINVRSIVLTSETQILVRVAAEFNAAAGSRTIILTRPDYLQTAMKTASQIVK